MTRPPRTPGLETDPVERMIDGSLAAVSRVRVRVDVEARVMAAARLAPARRVSPAPLSTRQKAVLSGTGVTALLVEAAFWAGLGALLVGAPSLAALRNPLGALTSTVTRLGAVSRAVGDVCAALARAALTVLDGLSLLLPSPEVMAASFMLAVSILTFITVRRDLHRSPAARGFR